MHTLMHGCKDGGLDEETWRMENLGFQEQSKNESGRQTVHLSQVGDLGLLLLLKSSSLCMPLEPNRELGLRCSCPTIPGLQALVPADLDTGMW